MSLEKNNLVKSISAIVIPSLLFALLIFQIHRCNKIISLRNPYVLEHLSDGSNQVWNSLGSKSSFSTTQSFHGTAKNNSHFFPDHKSVLLEDLPSLTVHYLWCIDGYFEFHHYVSILSAINAIQPDEIIIHYRTKPRLDPEGYWQWLEDLERDVIMLSLRPLQDPSSCHYDLDKIGSDFVDHTGVFILGDVVITNLTRLSIVNHMAAPPSKPKYKTLSDKVTIRHKLFLVSGIEPYTISENDKHRVIKCQALTDVYDKKNPSRSSSGCVGLNKYLHPEEILQINSIFNRFVRKLVYGSENAVQGKKHFSAQIPNTVHVILKDKASKELSPLHYVSIKSAFIKGHVDSVYIHASRQPSGKLWKRLVEKDNLDVKYVPNEASSHTDIKHPYTLYALYNLLQHGGVTHFGDVIFMQPIPPTSRVAEAIVSPHYSRYRLRHRSINSEIIAASKGSYFVEAMLGMVRQRKSTFPGVRVDDIASHAVEQRPESVALDGRLTSHQVCHGSTCEIEGGHSIPQNAYTTRLLWKSGAPQSLEDLKVVQGSTRSEIIAIIDA